MPHLDTNFDDVPDEIIFPLLDKQVTHVMDIVAQELKPTQKNPDNSCLHVTLKVPVGEENEGLEIRDFIFVGGEESPASGTQRAIDMGKTRLKRICLSAGLAIGSGGMDTEDLIGLQCTIKVKHEKGQKDTEFEDSLFNRVKDYVVA